MKNIIAILLIGFGNSFAGKFLPSVADIVNEKDKIKEIDPIKNGYIGFSYTSNWDGDMKVDLKNVDDGNKVRISINPKLYNSITFSIVGVKVAEKQLNKENVTDKVILQQLPAGRYFLQYLYTQDRTSGLSMYSDTVIVESGKITSLGNVNVDVKTASIFKLIQSIELKTVSALPDSLYAPFSEYGINSTNIINKAIDWSPK